MQRNKSLFADLEMRRHSHTRKRGSQLRSLATMPRLNECFIVGEIRDQEEAIRLVESLRKTSQNFTGVGSPNADYSPRTQRAVCIPTEHFLKYFTLVGKTGCGILSSPILPIQELLESLGVQSNREVT